MELQNSRAVDKCLNHMRKKQFKKNICFFFIFSIGHWTSNCEKNNNYLLERTKETCEQENNEDQCQH